MPRHAGLRPTPPNSIPHDRLLLFPAVRTPVIDIDQARLDDRIASFTPSRMGVTGPWANDAGCQPVSVRRELFVASRELMFCPALPARVALAARPGRRGSGGRRGSPATPGREGMR
jgi:hypothetical protein